MANIHFKIKIPRLAMRCASSKPPAAIGTVESATKSRLRQAYEDSLIASAAPTFSEGNQGLDPTVIVSERIIQDSIRLGMMDNLKGKGLPLKRDPHRGATRQLGAGVAASSEMANVLASNSLKPASVELRLEVEALREKLVSEISTTPSTKRRTSSKLREKSEVLKAIIKKQHHASIADSLAFGGGAVALQCRPFDLMAEISTIESIENNIY